jgi:Spy/CpxP family protein refolding chaperone
MKNRMITVFAAMALSVAAWAAVAQGTPDHQKSGDDNARHEQMMQRHMDQVAQELNLTEQQKPQVQAIMKAQMEKMRALREQQEAQMKQLHESTKAELSKVLTPEQMTKLDSMHDHMGPDGMRKRHRHGGEDGNQPPPPPKE